MSSKIDCRPTSTSNGRFIETCLRRRAGSSSARDDLSDDAVDWIETARLANEQMVVPALQTACATSGLCTRLPPDVARYLAFVHRENALVNERIRRQCLAIGVVLAQAKIEAVLLKGAAWLFVDGPSRADRMLRDIDLLVEPTLLCRASQALIDAGYYTSTTIVAEANHIHALPLVEDSEPASVELHVEIATRPALLPSAEIIAASKPVAIGLRLPSIRHRLVHNVIHAQMTNGDYVGGVVSLRDLLDLKRLMEDTSASLDWASIVEEAARRGYLRQLSGAVHKASHYTGASMPSVLANERYGRRHLKRCQIQRISPKLDRQLQKFGVLHRALLWERDSYALGLGEDRSLPAWRKVNARRLSRIRRAIMCRIRKARAVE